MTDPIILPLQYESGFDDAGNPLIPMSISQSIVVPVQTANTDDRLLRDIVENLHYWITAELMLRPRVRTSWYIPYPGQPTPPAGLRISLRYEPVLSGVSSTGAEAVVVAPVAAERAAEPLVQAGQGQHPLGLDAAPVDVPEPDWQKILDALDNDHEYPDLSAASATDLRAWLGSRP